MSLHFIDKKAFNNASQLVDKINDVRISRALTVMPPVYQQVYLSLPIFFHYNHPLLPGFISDETPCGIVGYQPSSKQFLQLKDSFSISETELNADFTEPKILGIYSMGSTASIGQNDYSDLDIWICYHPLLTANEYSALEKKCRAITAWAKQRNVEINFFLIDKDRFRHSESGCLSCEDCGTTQNILLLDEFYRSQVRLAGLRVLWSIMPPEYEGDDYDQYVDYLEKNKHINVDEWLNLGGLSSLSAEEYFGAILWQLYKSIDSPYKAVLKTLLLEAYSWEYPKNQLVASEIKENIYRELDVTSSRLDSYFMMLERVTRYLTSINDMPRLDLVRRCFYLKVYEKSKQSDWHQQVLNELVKDWQWSQEKLNMLNNRQNWKVLEVRRAHNELLDAMMRSYRNLMHFAQKNNVTAKVSPHDIGVLTRKLYAAYEALPGKVTLLNPCIAPDLSEAELTLIQVNHQGSNNRLGWYLYNCKPVFGEITHQKCIEYHPYVSKLIAWCYFNGLYNPTSRLHIKSSRLNADKVVTQFAQDMAAYFPLQVKAPTQEALYSPCEIRRLAIVINLENDPTSNLDTEITPAVEAANIQPIDALSYGTGQICLVGSVDLIYRNSWNEVRTLHFSGEQSILDALKTILGKMHQKAREPEALEVFCYSQHFKAEITQQVKTLVIESIDKRLSTSRQARKRFKVIRIADQVWGLFFGRLNVSMQKLEDAIDFYGAISNNKLGPLSLIQCKNGAIELPQVIDGVASQGIIQVFFKDSDRGFTLYILNEENQIEVYHHCEGKKLDLIYEISQFYAVSHARSSYGSGSVNFNLPQFYQIVAVNGIERIILPFNYHEFSNNAQNNYLVKKEPNNTP